MTKQVLFAGGFVVLNPLEVQALMTSPTGPVVRDLYVRGEKVRQAAKRFCPVSKPPPVFIAYRKPKPPPGQLRDSLVKRLVYLGKTPTMLVGSDLPYALYVHEGTEPHMIFPKQSPSLVFWWDRTQRVMFVKTFVNHPGTKPNRFLIKALPAAAV